MSKRALGFKGGRVWETLAVFADMSAMCFEWRAMKENKKGGEL